MSALRTIAEIEQDPEKMVNPDIKLLMQAFKVMTLAAENNWAYICPGGDYIPIHPWQEFESRMLQDWKGQIKHWPESRSNGYPMSLDEPYRPGEYESYMNRPITSFVGPNATGQ